MNVAHEKLPGLDRERVLAAVEPVLRAHSVDAVELVWRTDRGGWVLELTVERPGSRLPGEGITIDLCSDISRDLSAALDVAEAIPHRYRLEVGSPGLERALYGARDFERFSGQLVRLKLTRAHQGQHVVRGTLHGLDEAGNVSVETERGELLSLPLPDVESARLIFEMASAEKPSRRLAGRGTKPRRRQGGGTS